MASDRFEDEYDADPRPRRRRDDGAAARSKVLGPAIGLIVLSGLMLFGAAANIAQGLAGGLDQPFEEAKKQQFDKFDADPNLSADQKKQSKEMMTTIFDGMKKLWVPGWGLIALVNLVVLIGGVQMLRLRGRGLAMTASVLAMIPFISPCCIGIPVGIWALVALGNPEVKAAFAGASRRPADDDRDELR